MFKVHMVRIECTRRIVSCLFEVETMLLSHSLVKRQECIIPMREYAKVVFVEKVSCLVDLVDSKLNPILNSENMP